jgi:NAD(P)H-hydrate epimerase
MLKILDTGQIRALDASTIAREPIPSIELMERACRALVRWLTFRYDTSERIGVVCGTGNNGGDGLGIARLLAKQGYTVSVWVVRGGKESPEFSGNLDRLKGVLTARDFASGTTSFSDCDILIDAVFGSGLTRPAEGIFSEAIRAINHSDALRVAVDIPSGLFADQHTTGDVVHADLTLTFQLPKLAFLLPENQKFVGEWRRVDIGLDKSFLREAEAWRFYMTRKSARKLLRPRTKFSHKGDFGHALLIAGSLGKMGAAVLAARGALRSGVGLLTVHVPATGNVILQSSMPEAMLSLDPAQEMFTKAPSLDRYRAVGIGPGLGLSEQTAVALGEVLEAGKPMVIDADALNLLSEHRELLHVIPAGSILTPHPREFERLAGKWDNDFDRLAKQLALSRQLKSIVLVKGAHTAIATPEGQVFFNCTGNPGMATGGTGDVLTGILTGLLGQGYPARDAALLGVYLHGLAGDLAARNKGEIGMVAGDLVEYLPEAYNTLV